MTASIKDVAALAGVSIGTVSNALNYPERVSDKTLNKVQGAIAALGFVRNDAARQLRAGASKTIALIVLDASNPFFADVARGAEDAAQERGYTVIVGNTSGSSERERNYLDVFEEQRVHGILISPHGSVEDRLDTLKDFGIPAVLVDRVSDTKMFPSVSVDDEAGGEIAVTHLLDSGRRHIGFVGGALDVPQVRDRLLGAQRAIAKAPDTRLSIFDTQHTTVLEGRRVGKTIAALAPADRPDALFAANDLVAVGLLQAITTQSSLTVPDDIALIGYDDIDFAKSAIVPLTSIRQPSTLMGSTAVELLLDVASDPQTPIRQVVFQPELVVRESTSRRP
jgi:LacI family transcriptional regulator